MEIKKGGVYRVKASRFVPEWLHGARAFVQRVEGNIIYFTVNRKPYKLYADFEEYKTANTYHMVEVRTYDFSKTKNRVVAHTIYSKEPVIRKVLMDKAKEWAETCNLKDIAFRVI